MKTYSSCVQDGPENNLSQNPSMNSFFPLTSPHAVELYSKPLTEMSPKR